MLYLAPASGSAIAEEFRGFSLPGANADVTCGGAHLCTSFNALKKARWNTYRQAKADTHSPNTAGLSLSTLRSLGGTGCGLNDPART
jgi:hypothetical protein